MKWFRHADPRYPYLWEGHDQPEGRWHGPDEGPTHYFADTPNGAWAEFIRHEEITEVSDLDGIRRSIWVVDVPDDIEVGTLAVPNAQAFGGTSTYHQTQAAAREYRDNNPASHGFVTRSAALLEHGGKGREMDGGRVESSFREGMVLVLYGRFPRLIGWMCCRYGQPDPEILLLTRQLQAVFPQV